MERRAGLRGLRLNLQSACESNVVVLAIFFSEYRVVLSQGELHCSPQLRSLPALPFSPVPHVGLPTCRRRTAFTELPGAGAIPFYKQ